MNSKKLNGAIANKLMLFIAIIAISMPSNVAQAHNGEHEGEHGDLVTTVITVEKVIVGTTTAVASDFSFTINGGEAIQFEADSVNEIEVDLSEAPFVIAEVEANSEGFTTTYRNCTGVATTCVITNTFMPVPEVVPVITIIQEEFKEKKETKNRAVATGIGSSVQHKSPDYEDVASTSTTTVEYDEMDEYPATDLCEIEGHKYDNEGNPLSGWVIGLMKTITQDEKKDLWNLSSGTTDSDGYYCLNWDGETRELRGEGSRSVTEGEFVLIYSVYEEMKDGWTYHSIEKGDNTSNLEVVPETEINFGSDFVSTQIGEPNGYIYADAAYHVDFYNKRLEDNEEDSDGGSGNGDGNESGDDGEEASGGDGSGPSVSPEEETSGSTGTRVGDRKRTSGSSTRTNPETESEPTPQVLGEQVSVIPVGGASAGHGGSNQGLTFEQKLFVSERLQLLK